MAYYLTQLHEDTASRVGANIGSDRFKSAFLQASRRVLIDLRDIAEVPDVIVVDDIDADTGLSDKYEGVLTDGVNYFLQTRSEFTVETKQDLYALYDVSLGRAQTRVFKDESPSGAKGGTHT